LKLDTLVVLDSLSKPMIFGGKGWVRVNVGIRLWLLRTNKTLRQNVAGVIEYNSM